jgi:hypothetical protein
VTSEINKPDLEALIEELQKKGANLDEVLFQSLKSLKSTPDQTAKYQRPRGKISLAQIFAESPFRGLSLDLERSNQTLRPFDL